jgi:hypothetical protein
MAFFNRWSDLRGRFKLCLHNMHNVEEKHFSIFTLVLYYPWYQHCTRAKPGWVASFGIM